MNLDKVYNTPPWWAYLFPVLFVTVGIYMIKLWRRSINPNASTWERALNEWNYMIIGIGLVIGGIMYLTIIVYQDCVGHI